MSISPRQIICTFHFSVLDATNINIVMDNNHHCPYMFKSMVHFQQKLDLTGWNRFRVLVCDDQGDNNHCIVGLIYDWCGVKIHPGHVSHDRF